MITRHMSNMMREINKCTINLTVHYAMSMHYLCIHATVTYSAYRASVTWDELT